MSPDDETLYADMREAVRGDRERAERRAKERQSAAPAPVTVTAAAPAAEDARPPTGFRRFFGRRRDPA
jgi:hypothetical protein